LDITHNDPPPCAEYRYGELDNVVGDLQSKQIANDFEISSEGTGNVYVTRLETNILRNISTANIYFYTDNAGMPGNLFETIEGIAPESQTYIGTLYGMNFYKMVWEFPEPIFVGVEGEKIWFGMTATPESNNEPNYLEAFDNWPSPSVAYFSEDGGNTWQSDPNGLDGAFVIFAYCGEIDTEEISEFSFSYYPNPVTNHLKVQSESKVEQFEVYNSEGKKIFQSSSVKNNELNLNSLSAGIYLIRAKLENGRIETFKVIKK